MTLPALYLQGLTQSAVGGPERLGSYKLGLIEAVLKDALRSDEDDGAAIRSPAQTALEVARWEPPRRRPGARTADDAL
jgi:hypothetical protein